MHFDYVKIGLATFLAFLSSGSVCAEPAGDASPIIWDKPTDKMKTEQLNRFSLNKVSPVTVNKDVLGIPEVFSTPPSNALEKLEEAVVPSQSVENTDLSSLTPAVPQPAMEIANDEMMAGTALSSAAVTPQAVNAAVKPVNVNPLEESAIIANSVEQSAAPIIWDEALPDTVTAVTPASTETTATVTSAAAAVVSGPPVTPQPVASSATSAPWMTGTPVVPVDTDLEAKQHNKSELNQKNAASDKPVEPETRKEIASAHGDTPNPTIRYSASRDTGDDVLTRSLLMKIRLLEVEKETLRKKLLEVSPGRLKAVSECTAEHTRINTLQAHLNRVEQENKNLRLNHNNGVLIPTLSSSQL